MFNVAHILRKVYICPYVPISTYICENMYFYLGWFISFWNLNIISFFVVTISFQTFQNHFVTPEKEGTIHILLY